jgi:hypothetical protein
MVNDQSLDRAIVQAMHQCGITTAVNVFWIQFSPTDESHILAGDWRFYVSIENPVGAYSQ